MIWGFLKGVQELEKKAKLTGGAMGNQWIRWGCVPHRGHSGGLGKLLCEVCLGKKQMKTKRNLSIKNLSSRRKGSVNSEGTRQGRLYDRAKGGSACGKEEDVNKKTPAIKTERGKGANAMEARRREFMQATS